MTDRKETLRVAVIGGGPAGLMAAEVISEAGLPVDLYEGKPSMGRKFLIAGKGGLNLTHSEGSEAFLARFSERSEWMRSNLDSFGPDEIRAWVHELGFETFIGSSGRVFPVGMQAAPLLRAWIQRLKANGVRIHTRYRWHGWNDSGELIFDVNGVEETVEADGVVLALGGASWPQLGSDGSWVSILANRGIEIATLAPANCGFNVAWSEHMRKKFAGAPVKSVELTLGRLDGEELRQRGEFVVSENGVEGSLIYAASKWIRETIERNGSATVYLDLAPDLSAAVLMERLSRPRGPRTVSSHLQRQIGLKGVKSALLREFASPDAFKTSAALARIIKKLPLQLDSPRPIEEAISTAGGVRIEEINVDLMLSKLPGVFCAGEMLDWEAPTGGYLLTASFATGRAAGTGVLNWLRLTDRI